MSINHLTINACMHNKMKLVENTYFLMEFIEWNLFLRFSSYVRVYNRKIDFNSSSKFIICVL